MPTYAGQPSSFYSSTGGVPVEGAWYSGQRYMNGQLLAPGEYEPGKRVSNEVIAQTNPDNVSYINDRIQATQLQSPISVPMSSGSQGTYINSLSGAVEASRQAIEDSLAQQRAENEAKMQELQKIETENLDKIKGLSTPFRENLEAVERERLYINENFEANQALTNELDQLLTEGNDLIRQQKEVTGLSAIRNPRIQKSMDDVAARAGVITAVINARNGQIAVAENMIDRSINAIAADRQDQINYYSTVLELNNRKIISLDAKDEKLATEQLNLKKNDLEQAQATANYVKQLLIDPATAQLMGEAGVTLNDSVESINQKIKTAQYSREVQDMSNQITMEGGRAVLDPTSVPADLLRSFTDSRGVKHYYQMPPEKSKGGSGSSGLTPTQQRSILATASLALYDADDNNDMALSIDEYTSAVREIMRKEGVDFATADDYATQAFNNLGYTTWKWDTN